MRNGITQKDLDQKWAEGWKNGYDTAGTEIVRAIYASIIRVLMENGNEKDEVLGILQEIDHQFMVSVDGREDCEQIMRDYDIRICFKDKIERVQSV